MSRSPALKRVLVVEQGGVGGVADYTGFLVRALRDGGLGVSLATASDHRYGSLDGVEVFPWFRYLRGGTRVRDLARRLRLHKAYNGLAYLFAMIRLGAVARTVDVVHYQGGQSPALVALALWWLRLCGAAIVYTPHNTFDRYRSSGVGRPLSHALADRLIVHVQADLNRVRARARARAVVIPYGAMASRSEAVARADARGRLGIPVDACVMLVFGQLRPDKGVGDVLAAARLVPELHVILAGEDHGALLESASLLAHPSLAARVLVRPGFQSIGDAAVLFGAADAIVLAYRQASQSAVLMLGYALERPAVVYPTAGLVEAVVDGTTGWVCSRCDVNALVEAFQEVLAAGVDECRRRGRAGSLLAQTEYSWSRVAERTLDVYAAAAAC